MNAMIEGYLEAGHRVKVLAINSNKYHVDVKNIPDHYKLKTQIELVYIDLSIKPLPALFSLLLRKSYHVKRFISQSFANKLKEILQNNHFDFIQFESLFISPYLPLIKQFSKATLVLRAHNIEHLIWHRLYLGEKNPFKRWYIHQLAISLKKYELKVINKFDALIAITPKDAIFFKQYASEVPLISIPFGIMPEMIAKYTGLEKPKAIPDVIFHLGSMDWMPNLEGIKWFVKEVWPEVHNNNPKLTFHLAGRGMPEWMKKLNTPGIIVDGEVPNAINYMCMHKIMVVPLFSGSGIRIKIIEGMLAGCAVITTSIGAEGIDYTNEKNIIIANNKQDFIDAITRLTTNTTLASSIGKEATQFVIEHHNNKKLISKLEKFFLELP